MTELRVAPMRRMDLEIAVNWAAAEDWNPGLDDAAAFFAADPDGFFMGWLDQDPVTAISVVRHSDTYGFLGFYLCRPEHRGNGYGWTTWQAGMAHLGGRTGGLDGVPAQEGNYERSGFVRAHYTQRYAGCVTGAAHQECRDATADDLEALLALDRKISGTNRSTFLSYWCSPTLTRRTMVCERNERIQAFGTIRSCREGHKIGPLFAPDAGTARDLIGALVSAAGAQDVMIDVPDPNGTGVDLVSALGLAPIFSCARMYSGDPIARDIDWIFGETTFELG